MCMQATCEACGKQTWRGCGNHVAKVMDALDKNQWCTCVPKTNVGGAEYPPQLGKGQKQ